MSERTLMPEWLRPLFTHDGWVTADWTLAFIAIVAACVILTDAHLREGIGRVGAVLGGIGWLLIAARLLVVLIEGGDPAVTPLVIIGLSCVGAGQVFSVASRWRKPRQ